ncbi:MAG: radical SAM protein [Nitrospiraceae bacterium]|nr:MAG: radical SAM protein [Nitrospiraceae bacterium]
MKILLANPKTVNVFETFGFVFPPLGLLYVAAVAEQSGHDVRVEDFRISGHNPSAYDFKNYDIVGITTDTKRFQGALEIAKRGRAQGRTVVMGGPHPAFSDEEILKSGCVDFIVKGEGEITFPALLEGIEKGTDLSSIKGLSYLNKGRIVSTPLPELIQDLDALPLPARHLADIEAYRKTGLRYGGKRPVAVISSSRGCTHNCNFCLTPRMYGNIWRARSAPSVMAEIKEVYHKYGYRAVAFCDDNFTVSPERVKEICSLMIESGLDIWWWCLSTPNTLLKNEDMVRLMSKSGAKTVYIGVESVNPSTLKEFNKGLTNDVPHKAVSLLKENGIEVFASYILGGINDDLKMMLNTIKFARRLDTSVAQFTILTPYPGTTLHKNISNLLRHRKWHLYDGFHLVFRHRKVPFAVMHLLLIWAYIRYYVRSRRAVKGFMKAFRNNAPVVRKLFRKTK